MKKSVILLPFFVFGAYGYGAVKKAPKNFKANLTSSKIKGQSATDYAKKLARIGEILLEDPKNIELADSMFEQALKEDPKQSKALFYKSFTGITMNFKGIEKQAENHMTKKEIQEIKRDLLKTNYPELISFVTNLPENIVEMKKKESVQEFIKKNLMPSFKEAVSNIEGIDSELSLIIPRQGEKKVVNKSDCYNSSRWDNDSQTYVSEFQCYDWQETQVVNKYNGNVVKLAKADLKVIVGALTTYLNYMRVGTAYNLKGYSNIAKTVELKEKELGRDLTDKEAISILKRNKNFLTLSVDNELAEITTSIEKTIESVLDLADMRDILCNKNKRAEYLFQELCMGTETEDSLRTALDVLAGPFETTVGIDSEGREVKVMVNASAAFNTPFQDLKTLLPTKFDRKGNGNWELEDTFNGIFPNGDYGQKLNEVQN